MDYIPIAIFWGLALIGLFGKRSLLIYLFFATMPFGSFAVFPTTMTMGLTFTPTPIVACILFLRSMGGAFGSTIGGAMVVGRLAAFGGGQGPDMAATRVAGRSIPYSLWVCGDSLLRSRAAGTAVCMRYASS